MSEKKDVYGRQRFSAYFVSGQPNRLKNLSAAVNATRSATRILLRGKGGKTKSRIFFAQKLSNLGPVLNKLMQLKRVTESLGSRASNRWTIFVILRQKQQF